MTDIILLPTPRNLERLPGSFALKPGQYIRLLCADAPQLLPAARAIQQAVRQSTNLDWHLIAGAAGPSENVAVTLGLTPQVPHREGYRLRITPEAIAIDARRPAGAVYAAQTLAQLLRQFPDALPALSIEDSPDFPARGVMLDISRDKVPTLQTLFDLVDMLAEWKINQLQLYTEHTFAYRAHPEVHAQASPMTGEDILALDCYCQERYIDLVPNQNSFGHLERWLNLPRYKPLAEAPDGFDFPWSHHDGPFSVCPGDPGSIELVRGMYEELLPHFSSRLFNVGCDETHDVGQGRSRAEVEKRGRERVYLEFLMKIYELVRLHGRTMQFWGDIILHKPELIRELPRDIIALEWGYEADHPFDKDGALFAAAGIPFYVCPGTSSWLAIAGRTDNAIANLRSAAANGLKHGAIGYLNTDWGDGGHLHYLPISYLGFAAGAAFSWCLSSNAELPLADLISIHAFRDNTRVAGKVAFDLGNVYRTTNKLIRNNTSLFRILTSAPTNQQALEGISPAAMAETLAAIDAAVGPLSGARPSRPDSALIIDELHNAAAMLRHAARLAVFRLSGQPGDRAIELAADMRHILGEHRRLWLARNRPGGLSDSCRRLEARLDEYKLCRPA